MTKSTDKYLPRGHARKLIVKLLRTSPHLTVPEMLVAIPEMSKSVANNTVTRMFNDGALKVTGTRQVHSEGKSKPYTCKVYNLTRTRVSSAEPKVKPKVEPVLELTKPVPVINHYDVRSDADVYREAFEQLNARYLQTVEQLIEANQKRADAVHELETLKRNQSSKSWWRW